MTTPRTIRAEHILDLANLLDGWHLVHVGVNLAGEIAVLCSNNPPTVRYGYVAYDESGKRAEQIPERFRILALSAHGKHVVELPGRECSWFSVQPLDQGRWILEYHCPNADTDNISVVTSDGSLAGSFDAGTAIHSIQTTPDGRIWAFYELEGLEGTSDEVRAYAKHGAICFSPQGEQTFRYHDLERMYPYHDDWFSVMPRIYWGHGANVASNVTTWIWTCEALVKLEDYHIVATWPEDWRTGTVSIPCPQAFAIDGTRALLAEAEPHNDRVHYTYRLLDLNSLQLEHIRIVGVADQDLGFDYATARGPLLYLITDQAIHRLDLRIL